MSTKTKKGLETSKKALEQGLAEAVYHWVNYVYSCGNIDLIEEHSIRYPLAEYLERKKKARVEIEQNIDELKYKRYDFFYEIPVSEIEVSANGFIEVKLLKEETRKQSEISRVFIDLVRLTIAKGSNNYFILFGDRDCLGPCFKYVGGKKRNEQMMRVRFSGKTPKPFGKYSKWFSFDVNSEQTFCVDQFIKQKKDFIKSHKNKDGKPICIDGLVIKTLLKAVVPKEDSESSKIVYIWEVTKV